DEGPRRGRRGPGPLGRAAPGPGVSRGDHAGPASQGRGPGRVRRRVRSARSACVELCARRSDADAITSIVPRAEGVYFAGWTSGAFSDELPAGGFDAGIGKLVDGGLRGFKTLG